MFGLGFHIHGGKINVTRTSCGTLGRSPKYLSQSPPPPSRGKRVRTSERVTVKARKCGWSAACPSPHHTSSSSASIEGTIDGGLKALWL